jgi:hypothetical protein
MSRPSAQPALVMAKECHGNLAHLLLATGRAADAAAEARACLAIDPNERVCQDDLAAASSAANVIEHAAGVP